MLLTRTAAEKRLPFEPLVRNAETVTAMKAARRGELVRAGKPDKLLGSLNAGGQIDLPFQLRLSRKIRMARQEAGCAFDGSDDSAGG